MKTRDIGKLTEDDFEKAIYDSDQRVVQMEGSVVESSDSMVVLRIANEGEHRAYCSVSKSDVVAVASEHDDGTEVVLAVRHDALVTKLTKARADELESDCQCGSGAQTVTPFAINIDKFIPKTNLFDLLKQFDVPKPDTFTQCGRLGQRCEQLGLGSRFCSDLTLGCLVNNF